MIDENPIAFILFGIPAMCLLGTPIIMYTHLIIDLGYILM